MNTPRPFPAIERPEPSQEVDELARKVIGAAIEVHRVLGPGYMESVYEEALCIEIENLKIPFERQLKLAVEYKGEELAKVGLTC